MNQGFMAEWIGEERESFSKPVATVSVVLSIASALWCSFFFADRASIGGDGAYALWFFSGLLVVAAGVGALLPKTGALSTRRRVVAIGVGAFLAAVAIMATVILVDLDGFIAAVHAGSASVR